MKTYIIENEYQKLTLLNYGATMHMWEVFKNKRNILISNKNLEDYLNPDNGYMGSTVGRVANRIKDAKFTLNGEQHLLDKNFGNVTGHGGNNGFLFKEFLVHEHSKEKITFKYLSKHLESNYPGNLLVFVTYEIKENKLMITYKANTDIDTIVNITNHSYFNLSHEDTILNHQLFATSSKTLETDKDFIPTGIILENNNNILNLNKNNYLKDIVLENNVLKKAGGLDHFFMFDKEKGNEFILSYGNKKLKMETSYPGFQIYTFNKPIYQTLLNRTYVPYVGVAIEPSFEPDAINHSNFSNIILKSNKTYFETITYTFEEEND